MLRASDGHERGPEFVFSTLSFFLAISRLLELLSRQV